MNRYTTTTVAWIAMLCSACVSGSTAAPPGAGGSGDDGDGGSAGATGDGGGPDSTAYCDAAADCPTRECMSTWCQPVVDEPNADHRWGVCRTKAVDEGGHCNGAAGRCERGSCIDIPVQPVAYEWASEDGRYMFGLTTTYKGNVTDETALAVFVPATEIGDELQVEASANPVSDIFDPATTCMFQVHVTAFDDDPTTNELPVDDGGFASFVADGDPDTRLDLLAHHLVLSPGYTRVRVLGRSSTPNVSCGLKGPIELRVTLHR